MGAVIGDTGFVLTLGPDDLRDWMYLMQYVLTAMATVGVDGHTPATVWTVSRPGAEVLLVAVKW